MAAILPSITLDSDNKLSDHFMPHQVNWILAEDHIHAQNKQVFALAEKSVRIGWTHADAFKNFRKRLRFKNRDYLFVTKDYPSAIEYVRLAYNLGSIYNFTRAVVSHGEEYLKIPRVDEQGHPTAFTEEIKVGYIKFQNGSRIIAFSANPQAMAVYGGDVGLDEFAKHPNAQLLWETAQGRITWGYDMAVWSAHDGDDTLFYRFAQEARAACQPAQPTAPGSPALGECNFALPTPHSAQDNSALRTPHSALPSPTPHPAQDNSALRTPHSALPSAPALWNLYYRVTIEDALQLGLLDIINKVRKTHFTPQQFLADCRARARLEEIFQQTYMCNPAPAAAAIVDWSAIERCRFDYSIERVHLESPDIVTRFGQFTPGAESDRERRITAFLRVAFAKVIASPAKHRLGFDVAASGQGDLAAFYIDEPKGNDLWLQALFTCRTDDWHFIKTTLFFFLRNLHSLQAAGDENGLGRQICWEAAKLFPSRFLRVNFGSKKNDLGLALMNQLAVAEKRFPRAHLDIAADYFALRKNFVAQRWVFTQGRNLHNPASHCDIAWAGGLATEAHYVRTTSIGARLG